MRRRSMGRDEGWADRLRQGHRHRAVLAYLARYTDRVAISNSRLIALRDRRRHIQMEGLSDQGARSPKDDDASRRRVHPPLSHSGPRVRRRVAWNRRPIRPCAKTPLTGSTFTQGNAAKGGFGRDAPVADHLSSVVASGAPSRRSPASPRLRPRSRPHSHFAPPMRREAQIVPPRPKAKPQNPCMKAASAVNTATQTTVIRSMRTRPNRSARLLANQPPIPQPDPRQRGQRAGLRFGEDSQRDQHRHHQREDRGVNRIEPESAKGGEERSPLARVEFGKPTEPHFGPLAPSRSFAALSFFTMRRRRRHFWAYSVAYTPSH
jgi:Putative transposase